MLVDEKLVTCYGQYKRIRGLYEGVLTGKGLSYGGSLARTEATGYGLLYFTDEMLKCNGKSIKVKQLLFLVQVMLLFTLLKKLSS